MELIVALAIFSVVATVSSASVLSSMRAHGELRATQIAMNNLGFALESMTRTLRVGTTYHCDILSGTISQPQDCGAGASSIAFEASGGSGATPLDQVVYRLNGSSIERSESGGLTFFPVTASEVVVTRLRFFVEDSLPPPDVEQATVFIAIEGYTAPAPNTRSDFRIQTFVTQRIRDL